VPGCCGQEERAVSNTFPVIVSAPLYSGFVHILLLLSLITLFAGPLIFSRIAKGGIVAQAIDRAIILVLIFLVAALLLPDIVRSLGWVAVVLVILGYLVPTILELSVRRAAATLHVASLMLALFGLLLHAMLDGAGLAGSQLQSSSGLAMAIILHRFGLGMMIWLIMQPAFGQNAAWLMLIGMGAATVAGFEFSSHVLPLAGALAIAALQAVIIGIIIHGLIHRGHVHTAGHKHGAGNQADS